jgi:hypothetical protein
LDVDGDGAVNGLDRAQFRTRFRTTVLRGDGLVACRQQSGFQPEAGVEDEHGGPPDQAIFELTRHGDAAVIVLGERLRPVKAADDRTVRRWLADLDSERFAVRERAEAELRKLGEAAAPALRGRLTTRASEEFSSRAERLLKRFDDPASDGDGLRQLRALEVLETVGTPAAQRVLRALAGGETEARLTRDARATLERLEHGRSPTR